MCMLDFMCTMFWRFELPSGTEVMQYRRQIKLGVTFNTKIGFPTNNIKHSVPIQNSCFQAIFSVRWQL